MDEAPFISNPYVLEVLINDFELRLQQVSSDSSLSPLDKFSFLSFYFSQISTLKTFLEHGKH